MKRNIASSRPSPRGWKSGAPGSSAFTLVELLVVIAIITLLAAMLLPAFSRAKQKTRMARCINNLKQLGLGISLYMHDYADTFPSMQVYEPDGQIKSTFLAIGGEDVRPGGLGIPSTKIRPLYGYVKPSEVFHCPEDKGYEGFLGYWDFDRAVQTNAMPSSWERRGCSYMYNVLPPDRTRLPVDPAARTIGYQMKLNWVPRPDLFILMHEPPARSFASGKPSGGLFYHWHEARFPTIVTLEKLATDHQHFISPILFVDGHAASHDFTETIRSDPRYCFEPTRNWVWYKPQPR